MTNRFDTSHRTETPDTVMSDIIETIEEMNPITSSNASPERSPTHNQGLGSTLPIPSSHQITTDHPFLRWATAHSSSEQLSNFATIRHANIIVYSFRIRDIHDMEQFFHRRASAHHLGSKLKLLDLMKSAIMLQARDLYELARYWTSKTPVVDNANGTITVSLFYHTYCRPNDWQIVRQIQCIIWPEDYYQQKMNGLNGVLVDKLRKQQPVRLDRLLSSFVQLRSLSGRHSLYSALNDYCLLPFVSDRTVDWAPGTIFGIRPTIMKMCIGLLDDNLLFADRPNQVEGISTVDGDEGNTEILQSILGEVPGWQQAVVVVRPDWWPSESPKFCLFVLLNDDYDNREVLVKLLRDEFSRRRFYGLDRCSPSDTRRLREWLSWLEASSL